MTTWAIDATTWRLVWSDAPFRYQDWVFTAAEWTEQRWPGCPVCGTTVDVQRIDVGTARAPDAVMVSTWECPNGCQRPIYSHGSTALFASQAVSDLYQPE